MRVAGERKAKPRPPAGLGSEARALWWQVLKALLDGWELDERELSILALAVRQRDDLAALERAIKRDGAMVNGSTGQPVVNPAILEARQARLAINRMLGTLQLPDAGEVPKDDAANRARRAARARWDNPLQKVLRDG